MFRHNVILEKENLSEHKTHFLNYCFIYLMKKHIKPPCHLWITPLNVITGITTFCSNYCNQILPIIWYQSFTPLRRNFNSLFYFNKDKLVGFWSCHKIPWAWESTSWLLHCGIPPPFCLPPSTMWKWCCVVYSFATMVMWTIVAAPQQEQEPPPIMF